MQGCCGSRKFDPNHGSRIIEKFVIRITDQRSSGKLWSGSRITNHSWKKWSGSNFTDRFSDHFKEIVLGTKLVFLNWRLNKNVKKRNSLHLIFKKFAITHYTGVGKSQHQLQNLQKLKNEIFLISKSFSFFINKSKTKHPGEKLMTLSRLEI